MVKPQCDSSRKQARGRTTTRGSEATKGLHTDVRPLIDCSITQLIGKLMGERRKAKVMCRDPVPHVDVPWAITHCLYLRYGGYGRGMSALRVDPSRISLIAPY